jgi:carboxymethylenebutenolidase
MLARRDLLKGVAAVPAAGLPLATILANPELARAAAGDLETVTITNARGSRVSGALALPAQTPAATVAVIHEWWGLNDQIKAFAGELARLGYVALAVDLMGGAVATTPDAARAQMQAVDGDEATATMTSWVEWLRGLSRGSGKVGTIGFCFGGGWSLNASLARPVDATVIYYGNVAKTAGQLAPLRGPVLGHFATQDQFINKAMVDGFEKTMAEAGKPLEVHWYDANHGFANPSGGRYDAEDTQLAMTRTMAFFEKNLG